jgi:hypothetical protein
MTYEVNEMSAASRGSLAGVAPAAYMVDVDGIGSIMPLCRDKVEVEGMRARFAGRVRKIVPLYAWSEWEEIRKAGDRVSREEAYKVIEMELNALHAENAKLRWRLAAAEMRTRNGSPDESETGH